MRNKKKLILYGAGEIGERALRYYGARNVAFFVDKNKAGGRWRNKRVLSIEAFSAIYAKYTVVITTDYFLSVQQDLCARGIDATEFEVFGDKCHRGVRNLLELARNDYKHLEKNCIVKGLEKKCRSWDLISSEARFPDYLEMLHTIQEHRERLRKNDRSAVMDRYIGYWEEASYFGHVHELLRYAGLPSWRRLALPCIEHASFLGEQIDDKNGFSILVTSARRNAQIHERWPNRPVFPIGPYIHYAKPFLSPERESAIKNQWGKTLMLFPAHSTPDTQCDFSGKAFIDTVFQRYRGQFDTLAACVFYNDLESDMVERARQPGIRLVSAGFRFDRTFLSRLRTIINLSDAAICNHMGTQVGYCVYFKKPVECILPDAVQYSLPTFVQERFEENNRRFLSLFATGKLEITQQQEAFLSEFYGFSDVRDPETISDIFSLATTLFIRSGGVFKEEDLYARELLQELSCKTDSTSQRRRILLEQALKE